MAQQTKAQKNGAPENEEPEFEVVETDAQGNDIVPEGDGDDQAGHEEAQADGAEFVDDDDDGDDRVGHVEGEQDEPPEQRRRVSRNVENRAKRQRRSQERRLQDQRIEQLVQTVVDMQGRLAQAEGRTLQFNAQALQQQLQQVEALLETARDTYQTCLANGDHAGAAETNDTQFELREQKRLLNAQLARAQQQVRQPRQQQPRQQGAQPPQVDPRVVVRAEDFASAHPWYDPTGGDKDSAHVLRLDNELLREGFDPRSADYWKELGTRVREDLPHRFQAPRRRTQQAADDVDTTTGAPAPRIRGPRMAAPAQNGGRPTQLAKNQVRVTPERKAAMIAAGKWDDPQKRNKQLAAYKRYDDEQAARTGR